MSDGVAGQSVGLGADDAADLALDRTKILAALTRRTTAITDPDVQRLAYGTIIATEATIGILCLAGAFRLFRRRGDRGAFIAAKTLPASGLVLMWLLYFSGFVNVGGEWFLMWQSKVWNGQQAAVMFLTCATLVLIVLLLPEEAPERER